MGLIEEIQRRRTFAIISHPDAGKTTLTEKLLLYGGAIDRAGSVKAREGGAAAHSDWMSIEQERGISVTSAAMQFEYHGRAINLLDTPGHQDFSEDTYRALTAADSVVMLLDCAKGVEEQTKKLFRVASERKLPIFTFVNKLDRPGRDPVELIDEVEELFGLHAVPMTWPIGSGTDFKGVYVRATGQIQVFERAKAGQKARVAGKGGLDDPEIAALLTPAELQQLKDDVDLMNHVLPAFDREAFLRGEQSPMFFGSAVNNFGVAEFLEEFLDLAPAPGPRPLMNGGEVLPEQPFTAFVFKVQANMNKAHRDRVAFARIVSGKFDRGMDALHVREKKSIKLNYPHMFFGRERQIVDEAYPGDILGLINPGLFRIGDVLSASGVIEFHAVPRFSPEQFASVRLADPGARKGFLKGLGQIAEEGVVQVFWPKGGAPLPILGAIGRLQFEVLQHRLKDEYACPVLLEPRGFQMARWLKGGWPEPSRYWGELVEDTEGNPAILFENDWQRRTTAEKSPDLTFLEHPPK
ncbi:peptide chain release factor 3 [Geothrix campi]|uniref:peptide chain release factor 3 n=1 Tax=Geothrix campi TaxID=2966450 RepID=UPI0021472ED6|nr:peptide chain release factor 3 [Geothrix sp. SG10]